MPLYEVYGLTVSSALSLPELLPGKGEADVFLDVSERHAATSVPSPICCVSASPELACLAWGGVGELQIEAGQRLTLVPASDADEAALRLFVLGAGFGALLHQRGLLVFHASAVAMEQGVVGFFGGKGWGKSTTAAALHKRGHPLVSDELVAVHFDHDEQPWVVPGSPQIRLWSDALGGEGEQAGAAVRVRPGVDKFSVSAASSSRETRVFRCAYLLDAGTDTLIRPVPPSEAFLGLVPNLYVSRFGTGFLAATGARRTFQQLNAFVKKTPVRRLVRRRDLGRMSEVAQLVERDIAHELAPAM